MFTTLTIEGFRGIKRLKLENLAPITLFTGDNGAGKSTVLEAALALCGRFNPQWILNLQAHRGFEMWTQDEGPNYSGLFAEFSDIGEATVAGKDESGSLKKVVIERDDATASVVARASRASLSTDLRITAPVLSVKAYEGTEIANESKLNWIAEAGKSRLEITGQRKSQHEALLHHPGTRTAGSEEEVRFGEASASGRANEIVKALSVFDPQIEKIEYVRTRKGQYFLAHRKDGPAPLGLLGGGINNIFMYFVDLDATRGGWLGIDEIDNGIHYKHLPKIVRMLVDGAVDSQTQLMMSTHSHEAVKALVSAGEERMYDAVGVVHLQREPDGQIVATQFRGKDLAASVDLGYELR
jgi:hypothetical protein